MTTPRIFAPALSGLILLAAGPSGAASLPEARKTMEACVDRVLSDLQRRDAPDKDVGPAVLGRCDAPLRAAIGAAIAAKQAFICSDVDGCLPFAKVQATQKALEGYRKRTGRAGGLF